MKGAKPTTKLVLGKYAHLQLHRIGLQGLSTTPKDVECEINFINNGYN